MKNLLMMFGALLPFMAMAAEVLPSAVPLDSEELAAPAALEPAAGPFVSASSVLVSATLPAGLVPVDLYTVTTSVTLPDTAGFARDAALIQLARQALPMVLSRWQPPVSPEKALAFAKAVGDPMKFVSSYKIIKETIVPAYTLTASMTFNPAMLKPNFGTVKVVTAGVVSSSSLVSAGGGISDSAPIPPLPSRTLSLKIVNPSLDRLADVKKVADALPGTTSRWAQFSTLRAELVIMTPLDNDRILEAYKASRMEPAVVGDASSSTEFELAF